jgi:hypothetical protein
MNKIIFPFPEESGKYNLAIGEGGFRPFLREKAEIINPKRFG